MPNDIIVSLPEHEHPLVIYQEEKEIVECGLLHSLVSFVHIW